jgi:hypothetical protein
MKKTYVAALLVAASLAVATARAGGPPPYYILVEKVVLEPDDQNPERVQIWGYFTHAPASNPRLDKFSDPEYGWWYVSGGGDECREQWLRLRKDAGTGKVLALGMCGEAKLALALPIRKPDARPDRPDGTYPLEEIALYEGDLYAKGRFENGEPVQRLRAFAKEDREARKRNEGRPEP